MPCCDVMEFVDDWNQHPPLHVIVPQYIGYKPPAKVKERSVTRQRRADAKPLAAAPTKDRLIFEELKNAGQYFTGRNGV